MEKKLAFAFLLAFALFTLCACSARTAAPVTADDNGESVTTDAADEAVTDTADAVPGDTDKEITMRAILDANSAETLFKTYSGLLKTYQYPGGDGDGNRVSEYANGDYILVDFGYEQDLHFRDGSNSYIYDEEGYAAVLEFDYDPSYFDYPAFDAELTLQEEIISVTRDGDTISVLTLLSAEAFKPYFDENAFPYADGDSLEEAYLLNASDYALLQDKSALIHADGSREEGTQIDIVYNVDTPERVADLLAHKNATDIRTGTVTLDPNTPQERSASASAQKGDSILLLTPAGYDDFFLDPDCSVPEDESQAPDKTADFHLYSKLTEE